MIDLYYDCCSFGHNYIIWYEKDMTGRIGPNKRGWCMQVYHEKDLFSRFLCNFCPYCGAELLLTKGPFETTPPPEKPQSLKPWEFIRGDWQG